MQCRKPTPLRTTLIKPMEDYFGLRKIAGGVSDLVAIQNLQRIHNAGYNFYTIEDFVRFLQKHFNRDGSNK